MQRVYTVEVTKKSTITSKVERCANKGHVREKEGGRGGMREGGKSTEKKPTRPQSIWRKVNLTRNVDSNTLRCNQLLLRFFFLPDTMLVYKLGCILTL